MYCDWRTLEGKEKLFSSLVIFSEAAKFLINYFWTIFCTTCSNRDFLIFVVRPFSPFWLAISSNVSNPIAIIPLRTVLGLFQPCRGGSQHGHFSFLYGLHPLSAEKCISRENVSRLCHTWHFLCPHLSMVPICFMNTLHSVLTQARLSSDFSTAGRSMITRLLNLDPTRQYSHPVPFPSGTKVLLVMSKVYICLQLKLAWNLLSICPHISFGDFVFV